LIIPDIMMKFIPIILNEYDLREDKGRNTYALGNTNILSDAYIIRK